MTGGVSNQLYSNLVFVISPLSPSINQTYVMWYENGVALTSAPVLLYLNLTVTTLLNTSYLYLPPSPTLYNITAVIYTSILPSSAYNTSLRPSFSLSSALRLPQVFTTLINVSSTFCNASQGVFADSNFFCHVCAAGKYFSPSVGIGQCVDCPAGNYSITSALSCPPCVGGKISSSGKSSCSNCPAGTFSPSGYSTCLTCGVGFYAPTASSTCISCLGGFYSASPGSGNCSTCPPGSSSSVQSSYCSVCGIGQYSLSGASTCTSCASGSYGPSQNLSSCPFCQPGNFSANSGQSSCNTCSYLQYSVTNSSSCYSCPITYYFPLLLASSVSIQRNQPFSLGGIVNITCPLPSSMTAYAAWALLPGFSLGAPTTTCSSISSTAQFLSCTSSLYLPANALSITSSVMVQFRIYANGATTNSTLFLSPVIAPLVAAIAGGTRLVVPSATNTTVLDGTASFDPNANNPAAPLTGSPYLFTWSCVNYSSPVVMSCNTSLVNASAAIAGVRNFRIGNLIGIILRVDDSRFNSTNTPRANSVQVNLTAVSSIGPLLAFTTPLGVVATLPLTVVGNATSSNVATLSLSWSLFQTVSGALSAVTLQSAFPTSSLGLPSLTLFLSANVLQSGQQYTLVFTGSDSTGTSTQSSVFTVVSPPSGGSCVVTPPTGFAVSSTFTARCTGWTSPNLPLTYSIVSTANYSSQTQITAISASTSNVMQFSLPLSQTPLVPADLTISITDFFGASSSVSANVTVSAGGVTSSNAASTFLASQAVTQASQSASGNPAQTINTVNSVAVTTVSVTNSQLVSTCPNNCSYPNGSCSATLFVCVCLAGYAGDGCTIPVSQASTQQQLISSLTSSLSTATTSLSNQQSLGSYSTQIDQTASTLAASPSFLTTTSQRLLLNIMSQVLSTVSGSPSVSVTKATTALQLASTTISTQLASNTLSVLSSTLLASASNLSTPATTTQNVTSTLQSVTTSLNSALQAGCVPNTDSEPLLTLGITVVTSCGLGTSVNGASVPIPSATWQQTSVTLPAAAYGASTLTGTSVSTSLSLTQYNSNPHTYVPQTVVTPVVSLRLSAVVSTGTSQSVSTALNSSATLNITFPAQLSAQQLTAAVTLTIQIVYNSVQSPSAVNDATDYFTQLQNVLLTYVPPTTTTTTSSFFNGVGVRLSSLFGFTSQATSAFTVNFVSIASSNATGLATMTVQVVDQTPPFFGNTSQWFLSIIAQVQNGLAGLGITSANLVSPNVQLPQCAYFNPAIQAWSGVGCTTTIVASSSAVVCQCPSSASASPSSSTAVIPSPDFAAILQDTFTQANWNYVVPTSVSVGNIAGLVVVILLLLLYFLGSYFALKQDLGLLAQLRKVLYSPHLQLEVVRMVYDFRLFPAAIMVKRVSPLAQGLIEEPESFKQLVLRNHDYLSPFYAPAARTFSHFGRLTILMLIIMLQLFIDSLWYGVDSAGPTIEVKLARGIAAAVICTPFALIATFLFRKSAVIVSTFSDYLMLLKISYAALVLQRRFREKLARRVVPPPPVNAQSAKDKARFILGVDDRPKLKPAKSTSSLAAPKSPKKVTPSPSSANLLGVTSGFSSSSTADVYALLDRSRAGATEAQEKLDSQAELRHQMDQAMRAETSPISILIQKFHQKDAHVSQIAGLFDKHLISGQVSRWDQRLELLAYLLCFLCIAFCCYYVAAFGFAVGNSTVADWGETAILGLAADFLLLVPLKVLFIVFFVPTLLSMPSRAQLKARNDARQALLLSINTSSKARALKSPTIRKGAPVARTGTTQGNPRRVATNLKPAAGTGGAGAAALSSEGATPSSTEMTPVVKGPPTPAKAVLKKSASGSSQPSKGALTRKPSTKQVPQKTKPSEGSS